MAGQLLEQRFNRGNVRIRVHALRAGAQFSHGLRSAQQQFSQQGGYLDSLPPHRPTVEEARLMSLCGVSSLEDLGLVMSSPLSQEWLAQQNPEDQEALEDWYQTLSQEESL